MIDVKEEEKQKTAEIDPYTGEKGSQAKDAGKVDELVPVNTSDRSGEDYLLKEETGMDHIAADEQADAVAEESTQFTDDEQIKAVFEARQKLAAGGRKQLEAELEEHHSVSPKMTGGDLDAAWQESDSAGEEAVGGSTPTPDKDVVDELGQALGVTYDEDEPLGGNEKIRKRDRNRWELDPKSARKDAKPGEQ